MTFRSHKPRDSYRLLDGSASADSDPAVRNPISVLNPTAPPGAAAGRQLRDLGARARMSIPRENQERAFNVAAFRVIGPDYRSKFTYPVPSWQVGNNQCRLKRHQQLRLISRRRQLTEPQICAAFRSLQRFNHHSVTSSRTARRRRYHLNQIAVRRRPIDPVQARSANFQCERARVIRGHAFSLTTVSDQGSGRRINRRACLCLECFAGLEDFKKSRRDECL